MAAINAKTRLTVYEMCGGACAKCQTELNPFPGDPDSMDVDHIIPLSLGGPDDLWNLQPLCVSCSRSKGASESIDYRPPLVRRKYDPQRQQWDQSRSQPQNQVQPEGLSRIPSGSGSVTTLPLMSFGWSLRWRYSWMPHNSALVLLFWMFFFWIAIVWGIAWLLFQAAKPRPGSNRYLAFDAQARRWYTTGCIVAASVLFFLFIQFTPSSDEGQETLAETAALVDTAAAETTETATAVTTIAPELAVPDVVIDSLERLTALTIAEPDPGRNPYDRDSYQPDGWADLDGDCITTRHDVLIRDSLSPVTFDPTGCRVETGQWADPFTGDLLETADEATIDHHVPLAEAHRTGGWRWDNDTRVRFANDISPRALQVVGSEVNQSKADNSPDKWLPPVGAAHCAYAIDWINVKTRWDLTSTSPEIDALEAAIQTCTTATTPPQDPFEMAVVVTTLAPAPTTTAAPVAGSGPGQVVLVSCNARSEKVVISNPGGSPADLGGFVLHDEGRKHVTPLGQWGPLGAGTNLTIVSGDDAVEAPGQVVWKRQNVWNNDGDTANLIAPDGTAQTTRC